MKRVNLVTFGLIIGLVSVSNIATASQRPTIAEWLQQVDEFSDAFETTITVIEPEIDFSINETDRLPGFQVSVLSEVDRVFTAPVFPLTDFSDEFSVRIEVAGQPANLPRLTASLATRFSSQLRYWLSQDLTDFKTRIRIKQQEYGWSDFEVQQLIALYSSSVLSPTEGAAFAFAFWQSNDFGARIYRSGEVYGVMLRLKHPVPGLPLVRFNESWWWAFGRADRESVSVFAPSFDETGQALRWVSLNDRARTTDFRRIEFSFPLADKTQTSRWELPAHWPRIARRPASLADRFNETLPAYVLAQITELTAESNLDLKLTRVLYWLDSEFEPTDAPISLQQSLVSMTRSNETTYQLLVQWWKSETRQPSALIVTPESTLLALALPPENTIDTPLEYRRRQWLVISSDLVRAELDEISPSDRWYFLP